MKFGVSLLGLAQQPRGVDMRSRYEEIRTWVHTVRQEGFDYVTTGQHYLTDPWQQFQPLPLLASLVSETGDLGLVATLVVPLQNPIDLAESWGSLDVISGGRVTLSLAQGYRDEECAAFGVDPRTRLRRQRELVHTLPQLWSGRPVTAEGLGFKIHDHAVTLLPVQQPHPPLWIAANADAAVERAARWGLPWNINPHARRDTVVRQMGLYRQAATDAGHPTQGFPMARELYCAPTRSAAIAAAKPFLSGKYDAYDRWGQDKALPGDDDFDTSFTDLARDRFILGTPDDCADQIARYQDLGVDRLHIRTNWPGMPLDSAIDSLQLFAREVVPRFKVPPAST